MRCVFIFSTLFCFVCWPLVKAKFHRASSSDSGNSISKRLPSFFSLLQQVMLRCLSWPGSNVSDHLELIRSNSSFHTILLIGDSGCMNAVLLFSIIVSSESNIFSRLSFSLTPSPLLTAKCFFDSTGGYSSKVYIFEISIFSTIGCCFTLNTFCSSCTEIFCCSFYSSLW